MPRCADPVLHSTYGTYVNTCMCTYRCVGLSGGMRVCIRVSVCLPMCMQVCVYMHLHMWQSIYVCLWISVHAHTSICMGSCMHLCMSYGMGEVGLVPTGDPAVPWDLVRHPVELLTPTGAAGPRSHPRRVPLSVPSRCVPFLLFSSPALALANAGRER